MPFACHVASLRELRTNGASRQLATVAPSRAPVADGPTCPARACLARRLPGDAGATHCAAPRRCAGACKMHEPRRAARTAADGAPRAPVRCRRGRSSRRAPTGSGPGTMECRSGCVISKCGRGLLIIPVAKIHVSAWKGMNLSGVAESDSGDGSREVRHIAGLPLAGPGAANRDHPVSSSPSPLASPLDELRSHIRADLEQARSSTPARRGAARHRAAHASAAAPDRAPASARL